MAAEPLLALSGIDKSFPGVTALRGVDLEVGAGEVVGLIGENGAGKSTLIRIAAGDQRADRGTLALGGEPVHLSSPADARRAGIAVIHQELSLVPTMTVSENLFLGRELSRFGFVRTREEHQLARSWLERLDTEIDPSTPCAELSVAQQQVVEIAKALGIDARILIMDEPTAALSAREVAALAKIVRELSAGGLAIVYVSHRLDESEAIADRVVVLRDGERVAQFTREEIDRDRLIEAMVGRRLDREFPPRASSIGRVRLEVRDLRRGRAVRGVSFDVRAGEILGMAGLVGAGRTETARLIFGADRREAGTLSLDGRAVDISSPRDAIAAGIVLLTEDRRRQGLVLSETAQANFALPNLGVLNRLGFVDRGRESRSFADHVDRLQIRVGRRSLPTATLSGGNQQKVVLAKWLETGAEVMIFDEPTRGVDVSARYQIYQLMNRLAADGKVLVLISSEMEEILGMCDRILVLSEGRIAGEIADVSNATEEEILALATPRRDRVQGPKR
ncbi:MAG: sugar ABC transporter ATP-binding protein [Acidobacteriota bacterium]|nr:sugar ABC transporter ATP-binding protein [Acidobacteriota bacterium]